MAAACEKYSNHPERKKAASRAYSRACYRVTPGKKRASSRQHYSANTEKKRAFSRQQYSANPSKKQATACAYMALNRDYMCAQKRAI